MIHLCQCTINFKVRCLRFLLKHVDIYNYDDCWDEVVKVFRKYTTECENGWTKGEFNCTCNRETSKLRKMLMKISPQQMEPFWIEVVNLIEKYLN